MKYLILIWALIGLSACATANLRNEESTPVTDATFGQQDLFYKKCLKDGSSIHQCDVIFYDMYSAKLVKEYPEADINEVILACRSEPLTCGTTNIQKSAVFEKKIAASHNQKSNEKSRSSSWGIIGAAMKGMGDGLSNSGKNNVNCTTNQYGQTAYTNCR